MKCIAPPLPLAPALAPLSGVEQRVLTRFGALPAPRPTALLVGFSGGADSLALAAVLRRLAPLTGRALLAVHVDHGLRPESAREAERAAALATALEVPFLMRRLPCDPRAVHPGVGLEEAARRERYRCLADLAAERDALVCIAHHADDQAETVLLHLSRGAGTAGAAGMASCTTLVVPWWPGDSAPPRTVTVWRPFLDERQATVRAEAARLGQPPIDDPSNQDRGLRRNAIRHEVLPTLERVSPGATTALARHARLAADDEAVLMALAGRELDQLRDASDTLAASELIRLPPAIARRVIRRWLGAAVSVGSERIEAVLGLARSGRGGRRLEVGGGQLVEVVAGRLRRGAAGELDVAAAGGFAGPLFAAGEAPVAMDPPATVTVGGCRLCLRQAQTGLDGCASARDHWSRARLAPLGPRVWLRPPAAGDRWAGGGQKLGDWLTGRKVPAAIRSRLVCLASARGIHWVVGLPLPVDDQARAADDGWWAEWWPVTAESGR